MDKSTKDAPATTATPSSRRSKPKESTHSFPWLSVLVAIIALGISSFAYIRPDEFQSVVQHTQTRMLQFISPSSSSSSSSSTVVDCSSATQYLTDVMPVKGFHVLCIETSPQDTLMITAYKDGQAPDLHIETAMDFNSFRIQLINLFSIPQPETEHAKKYKQPMGFFTSQGQRLERLSELIQHKIIFLFEGGQFIYPGIRIGHETIVHNVTGKGDMIMETLSMSPLVFGVGEFLKDEEIDVILELSIEHLAPSDVKHNDGDEHRPASDWRTSTTYFLSSKKHKLVQEIDQRTADLVKVPIGHQEDVQVLRYEETQKYDQHTDYFPVKHHQKNPDVLEMVEYGYKNRMITVFWYMSDVAKGGHTIFPRAGGLPQPSRMNDCTVGLKVPPRKRKVIVFYSMLPNGEGDPMSLHGGCPVEEGIKYSGNKWVWNKPIKF